ncbi:hypothetical protein VTK73DRAFT_8282 [Phialemonium thermophilum]|uniref:Isomerase YbhE n=1 Tax=Phialemonium thermophilum TaxID=223376 RepID=A0ABR3W9G9_9PEZI
MSSSWHLHDMSDVGHGSSAGVSGHGLICISSFSVARAPPTTISSLRLIRLVHAMAHRLLLSGDRKTFTTVNFDAEKKSLTVLADYTAPPDVSWVEPTSSSGDVDRLVGLSEQTGEGELFTFDIDHGRKTCSFTSKKKTLGAPAHFITLHDESALALATYLGGSIALYPVSITEEQGLLLVDAPRTELLFEFTYRSAGHGPVEERQRQSHAHQVLEDKRGLLYVPDLGTDRVWIVNHRNLQLEVVGWLQCPPGTGPRHAVFSPDEKLLYVLGELSHNVIAFDLSPPPALNMQPVDGFSASVVPPTVAPHHRYRLDSSEITANPAVPRVLYASNRWELHLAEREPHLRDVPEKKQPGDAIAILLLSPDGRRVEDVQFVRTHLDTIRGMRVSDDGKHVVVCGQEGGGIEIYRIGGRRGEEWTLAARLADGLESGIKHAVWLG